MLAAAAPFLTLVGRSSPLRNTVPAERIPLGNRLQTLISEIVRIGPFCRRAHQAPEKGQDDADRPHIVIVSHAFRRDSFRPVQTAATIPACGSRLGSSLGAALALLSATALVRAVASELRVRASVFRSMAVEWTVSVTPMRPHRKRVRRANGEISRRSRALPFGDDLSPTCRPDDPDSPDFSDPQPAPLALSSNPPKSPKKLCKSAQCLEFSAIPWAGSIPVAHAKVSTTLPPR